MSVDPALAEAFDRDGFVVLPELLSPKATEALRVAVDSAVEPSAARGMPVRIDAPGNADSPPISIQLACKML